MDFLLGWGGLQGGDDRPVPPGGSRSGSFQTRPFAGLFELLAADVLHDEKIDLVDLPLEHVIDVVYITTSNYIYEIVHVHEN